MAGKTFRATLRTSNLLGFHRHKSAAREILRVACVAATTSAKSSRKETGKSRRSLHGHFAIEPMEQRLLLTSAVAGVNVFAQFDGVVASPGATSQIAIKLTSGNFALAGGKATLGFQLIAADGSSLDPAAIQIRGPHNAIVAPRLAIANLAGKTQSLVLADLSAASYKLLVKADRNTTGAFKLNVFLAGDANGNRVVNAADQKLVKKNVGKHSTDAGYTPALDANLSGVIDSFDLSMATTNLGDNAKLNPLTLTAVPSPTLSTLPGGGFITNVASTTLTGQTLNGQKVSLDIDGNGFNDGVATAAAGSFSFPLTLTEGARSFRVQTSDTFGQKRTVTVAVTLDTVPPTVSGLALDPTFMSPSLNNDETTARAVAFVGQTEPNARVSTGPGGPTAIAGSDGHFRLANVVLSLGSNSIAVTATDLAGNQTLANDSVTRVTPALNGQIVLDWNTTLLDAITLDATNPPEASRDMAIVQAAIYDSVNAIDKASGYLYINATAPVGASHESAVAAAAHRALVNLFPAQSASFDAKLATSLAAIPNGQAKTDGVALGESVADAILALRANDGSTDYVAYTPGSGPGVWQPTGPMFMPALLPNWATLTPFALNSDSQFRPAGPPALDSAQYAADLSEVESLGKSNSVSRTADQTAIAKFWADGTGTFTPAGHWNQIAAQLAQAQGKTLFEDARLFALLDIAMADAAIVSWDAKYTYNFWRPITAIRGADTDGSDLTTADSTWSPLLVTPAFPEYVSGHSTFSAAAAVILSSIFGPNTAFTATTQAFNITARSFTSFAQAAQEASDSRIYAGIHFRSATEDGLTAGEALGNFVLDRFSDAADTFPPTIHFTSSQSVVNDNFTIAGTVSDNLSSIASLTAQVDSGATGNITFDTSGNFTLPLNLATNGSADGSHTIHFIATDGSGNISNSIDFTLILDTAKPTISLTSPGLLSTLSTGTHLTGTVSGTGSSVVSLSYSFGGSTFPVAFNSSNGAFDQILNISDLSSGSHILTISATDAAGNVNATTRGVFVPSALPLTITGHTPISGATDIGSTFRPQVFFSRAVNPTTLNSNNFFASSGGQKLAANIVPADDGKFAWLFFSGPMPGASTITITVDGSSITAADNTSLDADGDGVAGGVLDFSFTTVSLSTVANTSLHGIVADPGPDLQPGSIDDVRAGPDGVLLTADDIYRLPIAGVTVSVAGQPNLSTVTGADGAFSFSSLPTGDIKLVIDGRTATSQGVFYFPEMVMDLVIQPGIANTVMASMTGNGNTVVSAEPGVYLPRVQNSILQSVSGNGMTHIGVDQSAAPDLTPEQQQMLSIDVAGDSLVGADGQKMASGQVGISTVPSSLVMDMLPDGVLQHTFDITVQAPGVTNFATPAPMTFPNVFNAAPGTQLNFLSFDHTTGRLVIEGTATVSADGLSVHTDPGTGITHPGWHGLTPPGGCGGSGGAPPMPPPPPMPQDIRQTFGPFALPLLSGQTGTFSTLTFTAPIKLNQPPAPQPQGNCPPPKHNMPDPQDPVRVVIIDVDGPLADFMKQTGTLSLKNQSIILPAGSNRTETFGAVAQTYAEMFKGAFNKLSRDQLYGSKIKITDILTNSDGSKSITVTTYLLDRWVDVIDAPQAAAKAGTTAAFFKTINDGQGSFVRQKNVDLHLPSSVMTSFQGADPQFTYPGTFLGNATATWMFDPTSTGKKTDTFSVMAGSQILGNLTATGTAINPTTINANLNGYKQELKRVIYALRDDGSGNIIYDMGNPRPAPNPPGGILRNPDGSPMVFHDGTKLATASANFLTMIQGFRPVDRQPGLDNVLFTNDDTWVGGNIDTLLNAQAQSLTQAFNDDYLAVNNAAGVTGYTFVDTYNGTGNPTGDVTMVWQDRNSVRSGNPVYGSAGFDADVAYLKQYIGTLNKVDSTTNAVATTADIARVSKMWALAEGLNQTVAGNGGFGISINISWTSAATFAQFVANTVSHEVGHTFGLKDAYLNVAVGPNNDAGCGVGVATGTNCRPNDIMRSGDDGDGDLTFSQANLSLLLAALGMEPNADFPMAPALALYPDVINLPNSTDGVRENEEPVAHLPAIEVGRPGAYFFGAGEETETFDSVAGDGPGGSLITRDYTVQNGGLAPLTISSVAMASGNKGFSITNAAAFANLTLAPNESRTLTVVFDPATSGTFVDTVIINSNSSMAATFKISDRGSAYSAAPAARIANVDNDLGGTEPGGTALSKSSVLSIFNDGGSPLIISSISLRQGAPAFSLSGVPADIGSHPVTLARGESFSFGASLIPDHLGLLRGLIDIMTNDPSHPDLRSGVVGTGLPATLYPDWGKDYIEVAQAGLGGGAPLRAVSDEQGNFSVFLPASSPYEMTIFDPATDLVSHSSGMTAVSGKNTDLTETLAFNASTAIDSDFDGLPDDIEAAIGTNATKADSDGDGIDDFVAIAQGLDPNGGRAFPTGVIASLALNGEAKDVFVAGSVTNTGTQTAYVATGSYGLAIVDASKFDKPTALGQLDLAGDAASVGVDTNLNIAAIAAGNAGLHLVNVANPSHPTLLQTIDTDAKAVAVVDGIAYVATTNTVESYDMVTGEQLQVLSVGGTLTSIAREGTFLYTMNSSNTLRAIDISGPDMVLRGSLTTPEGGGRIFVGNGVAYIAAVNKTNGGFDTVDVSDPDNLTLISASDIANNVGVAGAAIAANGSGLSLVVGSLNFVFGGFTALDIFNTSDLTNTANFVTRVNLPAGPSAVAIASGIAYVADGTAGLQVVNYVPFDNQGQAPTVSVTSLATDAQPGTPGIQVVEGTTVRLKATIADDVQVRNVELLANGQVVSNDVSLPFDLSVSLPKISQTVNSVTVQVRATDTGGNVTLSNAITFNLIPDTVAPAIANIDPPAASTRGPSTRSVRVNFSESIDPATVTAQNFRLLDPGNNPITPINIQLRRDNQSVQISYNALANGVYQIVLNAATIADIAGNALGATNVTSSFTIARGSISFINPNGGDWSNPANWDKGTIPGPGDDVFIGVGGGVTITHSSGNDVIQGLRSDNPFTLSGGELTINNLGQFNDTFNMTGGTLDGTGAISIKRDFNWATGTMAGSGTTTLSGNATLNINQGSSVVLDSRTLNNNGTANLNANLFMQSGASFNNAGTFNIPADATINFNGGAAVSFNNSGSLTKSGGANSSTISVPLNNSGTISATVGTLNLSGGGSSGGTFSATSPGVLAFTGGTHALTAGAAITGTGFTRVAGGTVTVGAAINAQKIGLDSGTLNGSGGGALTVAGSLAWTGGTVGSGLTLNIANGATLDISSNASKSMDAAIIANAGAATWSGTGNVFASSNATFNNSGTFNIQNDQTWNFNGGIACAFNNTGTLAKVQGNATSTFSVAVNNSGTLNAASGTITLSGGGTSGGVFNATSGTLNLSGSHAINDGASFAGSGTTHVVGGTTTLAGTVIAQNLALDGGTITGLGSLTVNGTLDWTSGTFSGGGTTIISNGATLNISANSSKSFDARTLNNNGAMTWTGTGNVFASSGAVFNNAGTFNIQNDQSWVFNGGANSSINNSGTITKSAGLNTTTISVVFNNTGTLHLQAGTISLSGGGTSTGTFAADAAGTLNFSGGTHTLNAGATISGAGTTHLTSSTLTVAGSVTAANLALEGGTLNGSGTLTVTASFNWTGGSMSDTGTTFVANTATLAVSGNGSKSITSHTLSNAGSGTWTGTGNVFASSASAFNNSGTFTIQNDQSWIFNGGTNSNVNNSGTITKSVGNGTTTFSVAFNNTGTLSVSSGTVNMSGGGNSTGTFSAGAGGTINFGGGTQTLTAASTVNGAGTVGFSGGTTDIGGTYAVTGSTNVTNGTANFNGAQSSASLNVTGGTLAGGGTLNVTAAMTWTAGSLSGVGTTAVANTGTLSISGSGSKSIDGHTLSNAGTGTWSGTGNVFASNASIFNNSGTFDIQNDQVWNFNGGIGPTVNNSGTLTKTVGNGTSTFGITFNNTGTVSGQSGTISLNGGGTSSGTFTAAASGTVAFGGGLHTLSAASTVNGAGTIAFTGATVDMAGTYSVTGITAVSGGTANFNAVQSSTTVNLSGGTLGGTGTLTVGTAMNWSGGTLSGAGTTTIPLAATLAISGSASKSISAHTLNNAGTGTWSGTGGLLASNGSVFNNSGTFGLQNDQSWSNNGGAASSITNSGTMTKSAGNGTTTFGVAFTNSGTFSALSGTFQFNSNVTNSGSFDIGSGTRNLSISGTYTQTSSGSLNIEIGGLTAGTQFDRLAISGAATLDGTLNLSRINGFAASSGNTFQILSFASHTGTFVTINGTNAGGGLTFAPLYHATDVTLTA